MTKGKRGQMYDDDDFDDGYDDDYYDEEDGYDAYDDHVSTKQTSATASRGGQTAKQAPSAKAVPPSAPARSAAKPDPAAKVLLQPTYPLAPHLAASAPPPAGGGRAPPAPAGAGAGGAGGAAASFKFDTPSPDDAVKAAQDRKPGAAPAPSPASSAPPAPSLPANKTFLRPSPMMQQQRQLQQGGPGAAPGAGGGSGSGSGAVEAAAGGIAAMSLGQGAHGASGSAEEGTHPQGTRHHHAHTHTPGEASASSPASGSGHPHGLHTRRPVSEYVMEPELAREVAAAAAAEASASSSAPSASSAPHPPLHLVVLGHVDAGKSSLMGRLLVELGVVSQRDAHKYQRDAAAAGKGSFAWAWVLDERPEERERGVTVDVAMTRFSTHRFSVTLLDAPGHRDFVPNMIAGAAQADAALLLVDGSPGGFEAGFSEGGGGLHGVPGGQTREHAALARSLGIEQMAVVVSKLDTVGYAKERFDSIRATLLPFLRSVGFRESALQWLPASGPLGENLVRPPTDPALAAWWGRGPCLVQAIDAFAPRERAVGRPLRLPVSDVFKSRSGAVVLGGKLEGGALRPGSRVALVPGAAAGQHFTVRSLEVSGSAAPLARAGDSVEVALVAAHGGGGGAALEPGAVAPGAVLCHPDFPAALVTRFELRIVVLDVPVPLLRGHSVTLHAHVAREEGHITALSAVLDPRTGEVTKARPRCLVRGQTALVEVSAARGLVLEEYAEYRALGRVALREGGRTLAVGIVTRLLE